MTVRGDFETRSARDCSPGQLLIDEEEGKGRTDETMSSLTEYPLDSQDRSAVLSLHALVSRRLHRGASTTLLQIGLGVDTFVALPLTQRAPRTNTTRFERFVACDHLFSIRVETLALLACGGGYSRGCGDGRSGGGDYSDLTGVAARAESFGF